MGRLTHSVMTLAGRTQWDSKNWWKESVERSQFRGQHGCHKWAVWLLYLLLQTSDLMHAIHWIEVLKCFKSANWLKKQKQISRHKPFSDGKTLFLSTGPSFSTKFILWRILSINPMVVISRVAGWLLAMNIAQRLFPKREEKLQISYVATAILMFCVSIMLGGSRSAPISERVGFFVHLLERTIVSPVSSTSSNNCWCSFLLFLIITHNKTSFSVHHFGFQFFFFEQIINYL